MEREDEAARVVVHAAYEMHKELGPGLLESVYEKILASKLARQGLRVERQCAVPIVHEDVEIETAYRMDLLVEDCLVVEVKTVEAIAPVHLQQFLIYLRSSDRRLGLLVNFQIALIKEGLRRVINSPRSTSWPWWRFADFASKSAKVPHRRTRSSASIKSAVEVGSGTGSPLARSRLMCSATASRISLLTSGSDSAAATQPGRSGTYAP